MKSLEILLVNSTFMILHPKYSNRRPNRTGVKWKAFDKLCDSIKTFLASRGFNEIQVYHNVTIKTLYEALSEWAIAFKDFAYSSLCQIFKEESNTTDDGELKKATGKLWNQITSCFSNQVKQKETKESEKVEKNTRELERIRQPVVNNDFDSGLFQGQLGYAYGAMKPQEESGVVCSKYRLRYNAAAPKKLILLKIYVS
ncbi:16625_t:CDS:2 [Entrophospora sp. SA101]|nr:16625_t:CDS:2 [Entrophospora sp. SA101]CAJ0918645.1 21351_t:CDS:2 [Entrophospora sp. SA101]